MKKNALLVVLLIAGLQLFAHKLPILPRLSGEKYYSLEDIKNLAKGNSTKSHAFLEACLVKIQEEYRKKSKGFSESLTILDIDWICSNLYLEEIQLQSGIDVNSLWNTETNRIENFIVSTNFDGPGWVYHDYKNNVHFVFLKANCLNIVWVSERGYQFQVPVVVEIDVVDQVEVIKVNSVVYDTTFIYKTVYVTEEDIYQFQPQQVRINYYDRYYPSNNYFSVQLWTPIFYPPQQMGGLQYVDNSYYNNNVVNNYYNTTENNYYITPTPRPRRGPAGVPGHGDDDDGGGPGGVGGFGEIASGSARITSEPINDAQRSFQRTSQQARSGNVQHSSVAQRSNQTPQRSNQPGSSSQVRSTQKGTSNEGAQSVHSSRRERMVPISTISSTRSSGGDVGNRISAPTQSRNQSSSPTSVGSSRNSISSSPSPSRGGGIDRSYTTSPPSGGRSYSTPSSGGGRNYSTPPANGGRNYSTPPSGGRSYSSPSSPSRGGGMGRSYSSPSPSRGGGMGNNRSAFPSRGGGRPR